MAAENSNLNLALRITADLNEAKQALTSLTDDIATVGSTADASNQQFKNTVDTQQAAASAARENATAQQALNAQLQNSVTAARNAVISEEERIATQNALRERGGALYREEQAAENAAAEAAKAHNKEVDKLSNDLDKLLGTIDPATKALAKLDAQEAKLRKARNAGVIDEGAFNDYLEKLNSQREAVDHLSEGTDKLSLNSRAAGRELRVLIHQLASGNIRDASNNIFSLGTRTGMLPPLFSATTLAIGGTVGAIAGAGVVIASVVSDQEAFNRSIQLTGNYAGVTAGQLETMARAGGQLGSNYGQVRDILNGLVTSGKFTSETLGSVSEAASVMAELTGDSAEAVVAEFVKMGDSVAEWATASSEKYHWLDAATYQRIRALEDQGDKEEAIEVASQEYKKAMVGRLEEIKGQLNWVAQGWLNVKNAAADAYQGLKSGASSALNLDSPSEAREKELQAIRARLASSGSDMQVATRGPDYAALVKADKERLAVLEAEAKAEAAVLAEKTKRLKIEEESNTASKNLEQTWKKNASELEKEAEAVDQLKKNYQKMWAAAGGQEKLRDMGVTSTDGKNFSGGQYDVDIKALDKSGQKAKEYNAQLQKQLDLRGAITHAAKAEYEIEHGALKDASEEAQSDARVRAEILDEYEARQKASKASAAEAKKSFAENQRYVEQLEKQANKVELSAAAIRDQEIATRGLTEQQRAQADAANKALTAQENTTANLKLQIQLWKANGDTAKAAAAETEERYRKLREEFERTGNTEGVEKIDLLVNTEGAIASLDEINKKIQELNAARANEEQLLQAQREAGFISEYDKAEKILELHKATAEEIAKLRPDIEKLSQQPGNVGRQATQSLKQIDTQMVQLKNTSTMLESSLKEGLTTGLNEAISGLAKGTMSLGDAVKSLGSAVLDSLVKMASQGLSSSLVSGLGGLMGGGSGSMFAGMASMFFADGGHIRGPGTDTSDSIPILASDYEYITRSAVVRQPGALPFLDDFNRRGMSALNDWAGRVRHSTGGLAGIPAPLAPAPISGNVTLPEAASPNITNEISNKLQLNLIDDPSRMAEVLTTKAGVEALTLVLSRDPGKFRQILGG